MGGNLMPQPSATAFAFSGGGGDDFTTEKISGQWTVCLREKGEAFRT